MLLMGYWKICWEGQGFSGADMKPTKYPPISGKQ